MKIKQITLATLLAMSALPSLAQTAAAPTKPDFTITGNLGIFSDYRFRGVSQTNRDPAIQGGIDFVHSSGIYLGNWNSNVDSGFLSGANIEMDFYGGWKGTFGDFGVDVGAIYYWYPGSGDNGANKPNNFELYIGGSWGPVALKYFYATTDYFGAPDSDGTWYLNLSGSHDFGNGFGINASVGYTGLKGGARIPEIGGSTPGPSSYVDYKIGGTYTIDGWVLGLAYIATNRDYQGSAPDNKNISNGTAVVSVSKSF
jgi:uncharacterized protein (TIGR02001 family)